MISRTAEYALRAVTCLALDTGSPASADILVEKTKVPRRYLTRVLQGLESEGLVASRSGPGGGYTLAQPIDDMTILDVINAVAPSLMEQRFPPRA